MGVFIFLIARKISRPTFAFLSAIGFIIWWGDPLIATNTYLYPTQISQFLGIVSIYLILLFFENNRIRFVALAGLCLGLSSLFKPTIIVFHLMALFFTFFARELLLDLAENRQVEQEHNLPKFSPPKIWMALLFLLSVSGVTLLSAVVLKFGLDGLFVTFFLLPNWLIVIYLSNLFLKALRLPDTMALRRRAGETFTIFLLLGGGMLFWQLAQIAYFTKAGALGDFFHMLLTASAYYGDFALHLGGTTILLTCCAIMAIVAFFFFATRATISSGKRSKIVMASIALITAISPFVLWYVFQDIPRTYHIFAWYASVICPLLLGLLLVFKDTSKTAARENQRLPLGLLLISLFAATNLLDAFPRPDVGHISTTVLPLFILFGYLAERHYDYWKKYLLLEFPRAARYVAASLTGLLGAGVFFSSLVMMFMFQFLVLTSKSGLSLYDGKLTRVPHYHVANERAKGITLHVFDPYYIGPPVSPPHTKLFFELVQEISEITRPDDKVFGAMSSGLMLSFLTERPNIGGTENCYMFQTLIGAAKSEDYDDFSDQDFTRSIQTQRPAAIVLQEGELEKKRFVANWPITWNFISNNSNLYKEMGPFEILVPKGSTISREGNLMTEEGRQ
jgi:hypothetical protein